MTRSKMVEPRVRKLLQQDMDFRNSTKKLLIKYWEDYDGFFLSETQKAKFLSATPAESILRARRELKVELPPIEEVDAMNYENFKQELADHSNFEASMAQTFAGSEKPRYITTMVDGEWVTKLL